MLQLLRRKLTKEFLSFSSQFLLDEGTITFETRKRREMQLNSPTDRILFQLCSGFAKVQALRRG